MGRSLSRLVGGPRLMSGWAWGSIPHRPTMKSVYSRSADTLSAHGPDRLRQGTEVTASVSRTPGTLVNPPWKTQLRTITRLLSSASQRLPEGRFSAR